MSDATPVYSDWYMESLFILWKQIVPRWSIFPQQGSFSPPSGPFRSLTSFIYCFLSKVCFMQSVSCLLYNSDFNLKINMQCFLSNVHFLLFYYCSFCLCFLLCCFFLFMCRLLHVWAGLYSYDLCKALFTVSMDYKSR